MFNTWLFRCSLCAAVLVHSAIRTGEFLGEAVLGAMYYSARFIYSQYVGIN